MSQCNKCKVNGFSYTFSVKQKTFDEAKTGCENMTGGGNLARNLDEETYKMFNDCCSRGGQYWIGLHNCNDQSNGSENSQYKWLESRDCTSAEPLEVTPAHIPSSCQGVSISLSPNSPDIPLASESGCSGVNMRYICQFRIPNFTSSNPALSIPSRPGQNVIQTARDNFSTLPSTKNSMSTNNNNYFPTLSSTENSKVDKSLLVGLSVSVAVLLLLAIILALFVMKRCFMRFHKNVDCNQLAKSEQERNGGNNRRQIQDNILHNRWVSLRSSKSCIVKKMSIS